MSSTDSDGVRTLARAVSALAPTAAEDESHPRSWAGARRDEKRR